MDTTPLETKGAGGETARAFDEFMEAFEAFKETNDSRLADIEKRGAADALREEKLARIEAALDTLSRKAARSPLGQAQSPAGDLLHKSAFDAFVRKPVERPLHRWVIMAPDETPGPADTDSPAPVEQEQQEPAA